MVFSCPKTFSILSLDILFMMSPHVMFSFRRSYESDQEMAVDDHLVLLSKKTGRPILLISCLLSELFNKWVVARSGG